MWKKKLAIAVSGSFDMPTEEQIRAFAQVGFDGFFTETDYSDTTVERCAELARDTGLIYQSIHAPFGKSADMWGEDIEKGDRALAELTDALDKCKRLEVPILVAHTFIGFEDHTPTLAGIERYGALVKAAEGSGVKIAFENTEGEEYLFALMDEFENNKTVGFCWDSGHEMCYNHSKDLLARFGDRLIATHLNDNLGISRYDGNIFWTDDLHLLPFDGIADWDYNVERLKKCGFDDILTFELTRDSKPNRHENDVYKKMPPIEYITEAYKRACKIASKFY